MPTVCAVLMTPNKKTSVSKRRKPCFRGTTLLGALAPARDPLSEEPVVSSASVVLALRNKALW